MIVHGVEFEKRMFYEYIRVIFNNLMKTLMESQVIRDAEITSQRV